jgi:hypothetical protein
MATISTLGHRLKLLGVDDRAFPGQRACAAGIAGAATRGNDGQTQVDAALDQARHLDFGVGRQHHERVLDAPVGGVGDMGHTAQAVELDVVAGGQPAQHPLRLAPQVAHLDKSTIETADCRLCRRQQFADHGIALASWPGVRRFSISDRRCCKASTNSRGAWGCRAGHPADRDCAAPPRCRPAPRTACAPNDRSAARRAGFSKVVQAGAPSSRITISRSENEV